MYVVPIEMCVCVCVCAGWTMRTKIYYDSLNIFH